ncbi:hypothetical protein [Bradyrhizobium sp. STM 3562]|uniref:hypothetical protein n=1 Tax=Bradyrhizobium sp. STM 3562 TaxID=578924 RepID=UPI00388E7520
MRASTAFVAGIGTVGFAIIGGLGGGFWIANVMNPHAPKYGVEAATLDRRAPPMPASAPLAHVGASLAFIDPAVDGRGPAQDRRADRGNATPAPAQAAEAKASADQSARPAEAAPMKQATQEAQPPEAATAKSVSAPEDAYAKAGDTDLKRQTDRRHSERAQRWAHRHRRDQQDQDSFDQQAGNGRGDGDWTYSDRRYRSRYRDAERGPGYYDESPRVYAPQMRMFDSDD